MTLGLILCTISATMVLPAIVDLADGHNSWSAFFVSSIITFFVGGLLLLSGYSEEPMQLGIKEGFVLTTITWVCVAAFAAMPFVGMGLPYTDAFFEAMSGLTTTGSTVLVKLDDLPHSVLLWRSLLQGLGGLGIVVTALIMLPFLRVGGMQLFQTESSERSEKVLPRALALITATAAIYSVLMVLCIAAYMAFGMNPFDAVCHALTTVSTAGFSTHDKSFGFFASPTLEWICILFMVLGALPFVIFIQLIRGEPSALWKDTQVRGFTFFLLGMCAVVTFWLMTVQNKSFAEAARLAAFNVTSIITTTGFSSDDYAGWGTFAVGLFFILMFVGGCSGSTSGGIKIYRLQVAKMLSRSHFLHLISPNRIITMTYNGRRLPADVPFSVVAFLAIYMATVGFFTVLLSALGLDLITSLSAAASALGNVGPGLGDTIGPSGNYSNLPFTAKWVLSFAMLLGRLELFTVLVLLRPEFWRN
ncbi:MAG: TrkH family potassium uptake protein [Hyphomicrobiaceae bacterium]|nr:TrkH family potassium uptake protein [Hyphomicrobiaceae bacterium]